MGCGTSKTTVVEPINCNELTKDEDERESKLGSRGDSAVSKGTADSGVVMEGTLDPSLPGAVPRKIPPLTGSRGLLEDQGSAVERPRSSEILQQLLSQGIIPVGQPKERSSDPGEAYNIMLDDGEVLRQRPPARLESLKERKELSSPSRDSIDHKMQQAEERRKQKEDDLKARLRTKSARVRAPPAAGSDHAPPQPEDQPLQTPVAAVTPSPRAPSPRAPSPRAPTQVREDGRGETEGSERGARERGREEAGGGEDEEKEEGGGDRAGDDDDDDAEEGKEARVERRLGDCGERERGDGGPVQDEGLQDEGLQGGRLFSSSGEVESDPFFQNIEDTF